MTDKPTDLNEIVVPLAEERLVISKQQFDRERVTVSTHVTEREELASAELSADLIEVDRVPIGREVDTVPEIRHDGDLLIVPVVREVLVKRLVLVEEIRLRRTRHVELFEQPMTLRSMEATIQRQDFTKEDDR